MASKAVSDTGPIIHLNEVGMLKALNIFSEIKIPPEVSHELKDKIPLPKKIKIIQLDPKHKNIAKMLAEEELDLGESQAISLALQEKISLFLTDDLEARTVAKKYNLEAHGTVGILLRAFRKKIISKDESISKIKKLHESSSLFITSDLINEIINSIGRFKG